MKPDPTSDAARIELEELMAVFEGETSIAVAKIYTAKGERLMLRDGDDSIRLDAIELESLSWQDREWFDHCRREAMSTVESDHLEPPEVMDVDKSSSARVSTEYAEVVVRKVTTHEGTALQIESEALHYETVVRPS